MQMVSDHAEKVMEWKKHQEEERANEIEAAKTDRRDTLVVSCSAIRRTIYYSTGLSII